MLGNERIKLRTGMRCEMNVFPKRSLDPALASSLRSAAASVFFCASSPSVESRVPASTHLRMSHEPHSRTGYAVQWSHQREHLVALPGLAAALVQSCADGQEAIGLPEHPVHSVAAAPPAAGW